MRYLIRRVVFALALAVPLAAGASDALMSALTTPENLSPLTLELRFLHRFYGDITDRPLQTVLGATKGANVGFGLRFSILQGLEVSAMGATGDRELSAGLSYALPVPGLPLSVQAEVLGFYQPTGGGVFVALGAQTDPLLGVFSPALSVSFDSHNRLIGLGAGLVADIGYVFSVFGELYPLLPQSFSNPEDLGSVMAFAAGIKLRTLGHQFMIMLSNTDEIGQRRHAAGTGPTGLHLGFTIIRRFWF